MTGREDKKYNDLFFLCSLIEYIARKTKNKRRVIVNALGKDELQHIYELADVYHSENIDKLTHELINEYHIANGTFDNIENIQPVPTHWDIGKVYKRLIIAVCENKNISLVDGLIDVYNSSISDDIDNYRSSMYYENPSYLFASYKAGSPL